MKPCQLDARFSIRVAHSNLLELFECSIHGTIRSLLSYFSI